MDSYRITERKVSEKPISELLCSNFVEFGYGIQVEPMTAELLFNRSFEEFPPYKVINKLWYDLYYDENKLDKGYEKDWSKFDWYHSGYEHNPWFAAPNSKITRSIAEDESTFFVEATPYVNVKIKCVEGGVHGKKCLRIENHEACNRGGLAQNGKYIKKDEKYTFSGYIKWLSGSLKVTVALVPEGKWNTPVDSSTFTLTGDSGYAKYTCEFKSGYEGMAAFVLWLEGGSVVEVDAFSLTANDNYFGWRKDVLETVKNEIAPRVIRWPGGCFASFYDWEDAIGEKDSRKPVPSYFWGGFNYNDVGSLEMAAFCEAVNAQQMVCVNVYHPWKELYEHNINNSQGAHGYRFPQFASVYEGAKKAAKWVQYLNGGIDTEMGALRAEHGHIKPFGVTYFEMDNEVERWFDIDEYANACVIYSREMKEADPAVKIGMVSYGKHSEHIERMLQIAGKDIDFLADRGPDEGNLQYKLGVIRKYNKENGTDIRYCNTEWLPYDMTVFNVDSFNAVAGNKSYMFTKWSYAFNVFRQIMMWQREGNDVLFVNFNNLANTHGQNVIDTPKNGVYTSAAGMAMGLMSKSPAYHVLAIDGYTPVLASHFQIQAAWDKTETNLVLYICNLEQSAHKVHFDYSSLAGTTFKTAEITTMNGDSFTSMNTALKKEVTENTFIKRIDGESGTFDISVYPLSFTQVVLK